MGGAPGEHATCMFREWGREPCLLGAMGKAESLTPQTPSHAESGVVADHLQGCGRGLWLGLQEGSTWGELRPGARRVGAKTETNRLRSPAGGWGRPQKHEGAGAGGQKGHRQRGTRGGGRGQIAAVLPAPGWSSSFIQGTREPQGILDKKW